MALGKSHVRSKLFRVLTDNEGGLTTVDPPALVEIPDINRIEANLVVQVGDHSLGVSIIASDRERPAVGRSFGLTVSGHLGECALHQ